MKGKIWGGGGGSLEIPFFLLKRNKGKKTVSRIILLLELPHTGEERLEQIKMGKQLKQIYVLKAEE